MRRATLGVALLFFANGAVVGSWLPRLPEIRDRLDLGLGTLGLILALGGLGSLAGSSVSGVAVTYFGSRRAALGAAALLLLALPLISVAPSPTLLAAVLAMMGFVDSLADVGMNAVGIKVEESLSRSIMTRLHGLWSLGTLIGSAVGAVAVVLGLDLRLHLAGVAALGLVAVLVARRSIPESPTRARLGVRSGTLVVGLMLAGGTAVFVEGSPFDWSAIFLTDVVGAGPALAGAGVIAFTAGMLLGRLGGDHLVDRVGSMSTLLAGLSLSMVAVAAVVTSGGAGLTLVALFAWGLGISVALPVLYKLAGSHPSFGEGAGLAALTVGTRLGFMVSPALIGVTAAAWGLRSALAVIVGLAALASLVAIRVTLGGPDAVRDSHR